MHADGVGDRNTNELATVRSVLVKRGPSAERKFGVLTMGGQEWSIEVAPEARLPDVLLALAAELALSETYK